MNPWVRAKRENEGIPFTSAAAPTWTFYVRRYSKWQTAYRRAVERVSAQAEFHEYIERSRAEGYEMTPADVELENEIIRRAFAEGCVASWDVTDEDGFPMPLNVENVLKVFDTFPQIYVEITAFAADGKNFTPPSDADKEALARGNFAPVSNTSTESNGSPSDRGASTSASSPPNTDGGKGRRKPS